MLSGSACNAIRGSALGSSGAQYPCHTIVHTRTACACSDLRAMYATKRRTRVHNSFLQALPSMPGTASRVAEAPVSLCT